MLPDQVAHRGGMRNGLEDDLGLVGSGGGELQVADADDAEQAGLDHVDAAHVLDADFVGAFGEQAPFGNDLGRGDDVGAP